MLRRTALLALVPLATLTLVAGAVTQLRNATSITKSTLVKIQGQVLIKATPAHVWQVLTTTEGLGALTGVKGLDAGKTITKVGDTYTGTIWSDSGSVACTFFLAGKELRVNFEPATGGYLCQNRIMIQLDPSNGTMLTVLDRYSDDKTETVDKTAATVAAELAAHLEAFRVMVEMP